MTQTGLWAPGKRTNPRSYGTGPGHVDCFFSVQRYKIMGKPPWQPKKKPLTADGEIFLLSERYEDWLPS